jgi:hypothetical protein
MDEQKDKASQARKRWRDKNKEHISEYNKQWNAEHKEQLTDTQREWRLKNKKKINERVRALRLKDWARYKIISLKHKCKINGIPLTITPQDIQQPTFCPVLGVKLDYKSKKCNTNHTASLDRIVPSLGYVPGNVITVSYKANRIKSDATVEELIKVSEFYLALTTTPLTK